MTLPFPSVPATVNAPGTQVKSADLNDFQTFMAAVKTFMEDEGIMTRAALASFNPIWAMADRDGRVRNYWGPEGYKFGTAIEETYRWGPINSGAFVVDDAEVGPQMMASIDTNTSILLVPGSAGAVISGDPQLQMKIDNAAVTQRSVVFCTPGGSPPTPSGDNPISDLDNVVAIFECRASWDKVPATGVEFALGFHSLDDLTAAGSGLSSPSANAQAVFFVFGGFSGNFHARIGDNVAGQDVDLGFLLVVDTLYTLRVEHHGANTPVGVDNGTAAVTRFFINGGLELESTSANIMASGNVSPMLYGYADAVGPVADHTMSVTTIKCAWNGELDADVPA